MEIDFKKIREKVGKTKMVRLEHIESLLKLKCALYAKVENTNITGSIKDRVALEMIESAIKDGILKSDSIIIEPTSGNTGIGLACIGQLLGIKVVIVMPSSMSKERRQMIKKYGAELLLVDGNMNACVEKVNQMVAEDSRYVLLGQFTNMRCVDAHYKYTGPEILSQCPSVDFVVAGIGTGGTISGIGKYMESKNQKIQVVGVEPLQSPFINKGVAGPHKIQGIGAGFIPKIYLNEYVNEVLMVDGQKSIDMAKTIHAVEDIYVGISSGAALLGGIELASRKENEGKTIVVVFPDSGDRYSWN